jgi:hypothetical protein
MFVFQKRRNLSLGGCKKSHLTFLTASFKAVEVTWKALNEVDKKTLKKYLTDLILKREMPDLLSCVQSNETVLKIFDKSDLQFIRNADVQVEIPDSLHKTSWTLYDFTRKRKYEWCSCRLFVKNGFQASPSWKSSSWNRT